MPRPSHTRWSCPRRARGARARRKHRPPHEHAVHAPARSGSGDALSATHKLPHHETSCCQSNREPNHAAQQSQPEPSDEMCPELPSAATVVRHRHVQGGHEHNLLGCTSARAENRGRHQPHSVAPIAAPPRAHRHARVTALRVLKEERNLKDAVALQRVKRLMSDLQSALQPVLAECRLTERAASRAALRQRCCLRHRLAQILEKAKRYTWNCLSGGATRPRQTRILPASQAKI